MADGAAEQDPRSSGPHSVGAEAVWRSHVGIPVRNLWTLLVYAADLAEFGSRVEGDVDDAADLPEVLARLLATVAERRLRRSPSRGFRPRAEVLPRVRGRIDWLATEAGGHLRRGRVACRFEELTPDTARNRLVRAALETMSARVADRALSASCGRLAWTLASAGVGAGRPSRAELSRDPVARHEADDRLLVRVAALALDLVLPAEADGASAATRLDRDEVLLRRLFERAVANFYRHELHGRDGWRVRPQMALSWPADDPTAGLTAVLPGMSADVVMERAGDRRIVLDTKFTGILAARRHGGESLKSAHLYQIYAYLRSQVGRGDPLADRAEGLLLHPALDRHVDEAVTIQGHRIRFATVDLSSRTDGLRDQLLALVPGSGSG